MRMDRGSVDACLRDFRCRNAKPYQEFMSGVKPALEKVGAKYLAVAVLTRFMKEIGGLAELSVGVPISRRLGVIL
jgi:hypothetical protein